MVDLEAHCFPPATTLDVGGGTWELVSPLPVILVPSSFFQVPLYGPHVKSPQVDLLLCCSE